MFSDAAASPRTLAVTAVQFVGKNKPGDYKWMVKQPEYADAVFIICENFIDMLFEEDNGSGTAVLRKNTWPNTQTPQAVGIPTGWSQVTGGFNPLDNTVKKVVRLAGLRILAHLRENPHVKRIIYSADEENEKFIGCGIFKQTLDPAVIKHISAIIHKLPGLHAATSPQPTANPAPPRVQPTLVHQPTLVQPSATSPPAAVTIAHAYVNTSRERDRHLWQWYDYTCRNCDG